MRTQFPVKLSLPVHQSDPQITLKSLLVAGCVAAGCVVPCLLAGCGGGDAHPSATAERPPLESVNESLRKKYVTADELLSQIEDAESRMQLTLDLSYTKLTDEDLAEIKFPPYLTKLNLAGCPITDEGLAHLEVCKNLLNLNLSWTKVTGDCVEPLQAIPNLRSVDLNGTDIEPDTQRQLTRIFRQRVSKEKKRGPK
jgi:hypothetical protein